MFFSYLFILNFAYSKWFSANPTIQKQTFVEACLNFFTIQTYKNIS